MTKRDVLGWTLGIAFLAVLAAGIYTSPPEESPLEWTHGGLSAPREESIVAIWIGKDGTIVSGVVERIGDGFYEAGPEDAARGLFNGPPDWWIPAPRRLP